MINKLKRLIVCAAAGHTKERVGIDGDWEWRCSRCGKRLGYLVREPRA